MTQGGQQFKNAYANVVMQYCGGLQNMGGGSCGGTAGPNAGAVTPQPFFEKALAGTGYCTGFSSCTAAVVANEGATGTGNLTNSSVWSLWSDLDGGVGCPTATGCSSAGGGSDAFNFSRTMMNTPIPGSAFGGSGQLSSGVAVNASVGYGNYNAGFATLKTSDWKGVSMQENFTWSKALGTGAVVQASSEITPDDPYNLAEMYGRQAYDRKFVYTMYLVYQPPFFKGQSGPLGRLLGGWTFGSVFAAGSGQPIEISTTDGDGQAFGEADSVAYVGNENAIPMGRIQSGHAYYNTPGSGNIATGGLPVNIFKNPVAAFNSYRNPILGVDTRDGGFGILNGLPYWNMDFSIKKNIRVAESISLELQGVFANILNHNQFLDPQGMSLGSPGSFGNLEGSAQAPPVGGNRAIELGARVRF
jgi:hypothetical protein